MHKNEKIERALRPPLLRLQPYITTQKYSDNYRLQVRGAFAATICASHSQQCSVDACQPPVLPCRGHKTLNEAKTGASKAAA